MLLSIIVIVLRETLEASILVSVMLSVSRYHGLGISWLLVALGTGLVGATLYALNLGNISIMFDYMGQEILNAFMQYSVYALLVLVCATQYHGNPAWVARLPLFMALAVTIAVVREGGELVIFYSGFLQGGADLLNATTSGFIGLTIGMSAGAICFYSLVMLPASLGRTAHTVFLMLIAGGMVLQATQLLIQADWLPGHIPAWDTNGVLPEDSIMGQLAYAVFGYEATPSWLEIVTYLGALSLMFGIIALFSRRASNPMLCVEK